TPPQGDKPRAEVWRHTLIEDDYTEEGEQLAGRDGPAWSAGRWLLKAAIEGATLARGKGGVFFKGASKALRALQTKERVVILTATPGLTAERLSQLIGRPVHVKRIAVKEAADIERVWHPNTLIKHGRGGRRGLLSHGRPDWRQLARPL